MLDRGGERGHEHSYQEIEGTENISAYEETTHRLITLQFHERGLAITMNYEASGTADSGTAAEGRAGRRRAGA
jgi:hypothetical protein